MRTLALAKKTIKNRRKGNAAVLLFFIMLTLSFILFLVFFTAMRTEVHAKGKGVDQETVYAGNGSHYKAVGSDVALETVYTSYEIKPGDSLSSIAREYAPGVNMSAGDYMFSVRRTNHIVGDHIEEGCFIVIPVAKVV